MKVAGLIAAGGIGERFGKERPKQFHYLFGKPVIAWSIEAFDRCSLLDELIVVVPEGWADVTRKIVEDFTSRLSCTVVKGGASRAQSVLNGIQALDSRVEWVAVHDAARPGIDTEKIEEAIYLARDIGACIVASKAVDTVKMVDESGIVVKTLDREHIYLAQTPQVVRVNDLLKVYEKDPKAYLQSTDEASVVESIGVPVGVVEGTLRNMKITGPGDLKLLELLLEPGH